MDNSLVVQLGMNIQNLEQGLNKSSSLLEGFKDKIGDVAQSLGAAFAVERIAEFGIEVAKLSGQADGVRRVFNQLEGSVEVLQEMKQATQGTVSELDLMKYAVQADNFNIPLSQMGSLFEFAHQRALATGQSVDYLVQSIVTGIGRKSPLILDNLGISAVALREKLHGVGTETASVADVAKVVGEIAHESLSKFGIAAETTASRMEALNASWENFKVTLGDTINKTGLFQKVLTGITAELNVINSDQLSWNEKVIALVGGPQAALLIQKAAELRLQQQINAEKQKDANIQNTINQFFDEGWGSVTRFEQAISQNVNKQAIIQGIINRLLVGHTEQVKNIAFYEAEIKDLREKESTALGADLSKIQQKIELDQKELDLLKQQFALERDRAQTAAINKHLNNKGYKDASLLAPSLLPPAEDIDKATASMDAAKQSLDKMVANAPTYNKMWKDVFDEKQIQQFNAILNEGIKNTISTLAEGFGEMAAGAETSEQVFSNLLGVVAGVLQQLGELAIGAGITAIALDSLLENPYTAIAAGVALVALAGAVRGSAKNIMKSHGSGGGYAMPSTNAASYSRGGVSSSPVMVNGAIKISGQDLWVILSNYKGNSNYTRIG